MKIYRYIVANMRDKTVSSEFSMLKNCLRKQPCSHLPAKSYLPVICQWLCLTNHFFKSTVYCTTNTTLQMIEIYWNIVFNAYNKTVSSEL